MRERTRATIAELRTAVDCLPRDTRIAMLDGLQRNEIIVGAYTHEGGICPMLAAHRAGGRTSFVTFARAWDRFAYRSTESRHRRARRATERELLILRSHLEASLLDDELPAGTLGAAISDHRALRATRPEPAAAPLPRAPAAAPSPDPTARPGRAPGRRRPGDPDRSRELGGRSGWAWLRPVRRLDDYERALARLQAQEQSRAAEETPAVPV